MQIIKADINTFKKYKEELMDLYLFTSTKPPMEQYLPRHREESYMIDMFEHGGYGYFAFDEKKLIGFVINTPLSHDKLIPDSMKSLPIDKCLYIAEMHVHPDFQGMGIGSGFIRRTINDAKEKEFEYIFIRSWKVNVRAIKLYERFGFKKGEIITQEKIKQDKKTKFIIEKIYLYQKL